MERATGFEPRSVAGSALKPASPAPARVPSPLAPSRCSGHPTKGAHPLRIPLSRLQIPSCVSSRPYARPCYASRFTFDVFMERATGFEPATTSLEGWDSTTELRPPFLRTEHRGLRIEFMRPRPSVLSTQHVFGVVGRQGFEPWKPVSSRFTVCPRWPLGYLPVCLQPWEPSRGQCTEANVFARFCL